jgi:hypothetical protein
VLEILVNCAKQKKGSKLNLGWAAEQVGEIIDQKFAVHTDRIQK